MPDADPQTLADSIERLLDENSGSGAADAIGRLPDRLQSPDHLERAADAFGALADRTGAEAFVEAEDLLDRLARHDRGEGGADRGLNRARAVEVAERIGDAADALPASVRGDYKRAVRPIARDLHDWFA